jgi:hypothetical protein
VQVFHDKTSKVSFVKLQFNVLNKTNSFFKVGNPIINFKVSCAIIVPIIPGNVPKTPLKLQLGTSLELGGSGNKSRKFLLPW